ncbi:hypothetical protein VIGAN_01120700 [Vigna angularis var. angularis]|uniref:Uncharacterized protein n=1 Tax=Vigna angularis var. angularis TaxID=157739 RepID=A0A0S3QZF3_PHAAN|nr:hypothetical protein VIGAN_01120700 [Vigna angularis var. angularis]
MKFYSSATITCILHHLSVTSITPKIHTKHNTDFEGSNYLSLTRNLNGLDFRLLNIFLGNSNSKNTILHRSLHFIHFCILRQSEPPQELPTATLHTMPRIVLIFLLNVSLTAYLKNLIIFYLNLHFLLLQSWNLSLEHVCLWRLLPVHTGTHKCRIFSTRFRERKILEGIPHIQREWIIDVAPSSTEQTWN